MLQLTEDELGEIIELTEEMCTRNGWVNEIVPPAKKRMEIITRARSRPHPAPAHKKRIQSIQRNTEGNLTMTFDYEQLTAHDATIARKAREQFAKGLIEYSNRMGIYNCEEAVVDYLESLRNTKQQAGRK